MFFNNLYSLKPCTTLHNLAQPCTGEENLFCVGIPNLKSAKNNDDMIYENAHKKQPHEVNANIRANKYFNKYEEHNWTVTYP